MAHILKQAKPLQLNSEGQVAIPAELQKALNLQPGEILVAWVEGDRLILRPRRAVREELWDLFRNVEGSLSEELIQERRLEAERYIKSG